MSTLTLASIDSVPELDVSRPTADRRPLAVVKPSVRPVRPAATAGSGVVRLTRRGRLVAVVVFLAVALAVMTAMGGWATATLERGAAEPVRVIEVAPGETLYDIAAGLAAPGEIREMVHRIQELNSLPGAQISEGQQLAVPRG